MPDEKRLSEQVVGDTYEIHGQRKARNIWDPHTAER